MKKTILAILGGALLALGYIYSPPMAAVSPLLSAEKIQQQGQDKVIQIRSTGRYHYIQLASKAWHVTTAKAPRIGDTWAFNSYARLNSFYSSRLNQRFAPLYFSQPQTPSQTKGNPV